MKLKVSRIVEFGMVGLSLAILGFILYLVYEQSKVRRVTIAAGSPTGESYIICAALRTVVERHNRGIRITLLETAGTVESLKMLEQGQAAMAAAQADVPSGPSARLMAILYDDTVQLIARSDSPVRGFPDLAGATIALPKNGGQYQTFLRIAEHFGLHESDFHFAGASDADADQAFLSGKADAVFRVRALGSPAIQRLVQLGKVRLVAIAQGAAMKIYQPAFEPAIIPAAAYRGNPAVPDEDLPSISIHRTLLASSTADDDAVRIVTSALLDRRQEIADEIPQQAADVRLLLAHVRRPETQTGSGPALHPGAQQFYDKDKPPFVLAHADYMGLILTVVVMVGSWIWELRSWLQRKQKNVADRYSNRVVLLMNQARQTGSVEALGEIRGELLDILTTAVGDLDADRLSEDSFHSFRAILQIGLEEVRDSRALLESGRAKRMGAG